MLGLYQLQLRLPIRPRPYPLCASYHAAVLIILPVFPHPLLLSKGSFQVTTPSLLAFRMIRKTTVCASTGPGSIYMLPFFTRTIACTSQSVGSGKFPWDDAMQSARSKVARLGIQGDAATASHTESELHESQVNSLLTEVIFPLQLAMPLLRRSSMTRRWGWWKPNSNGDSRDA